MSSMKVFLLMAGLCLALAGKAQNDTTHRSWDTTHKSSDTIHVGSFIIITHGHFNHEDSSYVRVRHYRNHPNTSTNWFIVDLGFANFNDKTVYSSAAAQQFAPGSTSDWFKLRTGKSVDVNIWLFMQRINLIKNVVNF